MYWPIRPHILPDELFSSWICRIASTYELKPHTLRKLISPDKPIWTRDTDRQDIDSISTKLSALTAIDKKVILNTSLKSYTGSLSEKVNSDGVSPWLLPLGIYHRNRKHCGLQFCPFCLANDKVPYFRKQWRLAFIIVCPKHRTNLLEKCMSCGEPVNLFQNTTHCNNLIRCFKCHSFYSDFTSNISSKELCCYSDLWTKGLDNFWINLRGNQYVYSIGYFKVLRRLVHILISRRERCSNLLPKLLGKDSLKLTEKHRIIEFYSLSSRVIVIYALLLLLQNWPHHLIEILKENRIWHSWVLGDHAKDLPYWFTSIIGKNLGYFNYTPNNEELYFAQKYCNIKHPRAKQTFTKRYLAHTKSPI